MAVERSGFALDARSLSAERQFDLDRGARTWFR
jgi:hypothetical protein